MSSVLNYEDRTTCVLFGDAAGAVLLEPSNEDDFGIEDFILHLDGSGAKFLNTAAATIPLAMSEAYRTKKLCKGDWIVISTFGAGFTWGSLLLKWAME